MVRVVERTSLCGGAHGPSGWLAAHCARPAPLPPLRPRASHGTATQPIALRTTSCLYARQEQILVRPWRAGTKPTAVNTGCAVSYMSWLEHLRLLVRGQTLQSAEHGHRSCHISEQTLGGDAGEATPGGGSKSPARAASTGRCNITSSTALT